MNGELKEFHYQTSKAKQLIKDNLVLIIAIFATVITSFIVPPDSR